MGYEQDLEQKRQWLKLGTALAENNKFTEALSSIKPIPVLPNVSRFDRVELTYLANEQAMHAMTDVLKADPQVWSDLTSLWANLGGQIADDIERMGAKLIEIGFPDPRKDHSNWRIIAIMVGADPDGMMEDIFEHAIAHKAKLSMLTAEPAAPAAMADVEKIWQDALLASLSPKNRLYVFCGRIWDAYRRQQEVLILKGERKRTRGNVRIAEAFPSAKANGWPEDQLNEFIKCAKEGIKEEKPWTDFVKGSKGKEIPLKKFLT